MRKTLCAVLLAAVLLLSGCTVFKSLSSGNPLWYYNPPVSASQISFIGEAVAETRRQAELLAFTDVIEKLSSYLGFAIDRAAYRELSTAGTITEYGLTVLKADVTAHADGSFRVIVLASAPKEKISGLRSQSAIDLGERLELIESLILEGDEFIKTGKHVEGVRNYIKSMELSYGIDSRNLDSSYSFDVILSEVIYILDSLRLTVGRGNPAGLTCDVRVTRKGPFISSPVELCPVKASFEATDAGNNRYSDSYSFVTDRDGYMTFLPVNPSVVITGNIVFSIDLDSEIASIEKLDPKAGAQIREVLSSKTGVFSYHRQYGMGPMAVSSIRFGSLRDFYDSKDSTAYIVSRFTDDGTSASACPADADLDDAVLIERAKKSYPEAGVLLILRSGVIDVVTSETGVSVASIEGQALLYRLSDGALLFDSSTVYSTGFGEDRESALLSGRVRFEDIIYTMIKAVYV